MFSSDKIIFNNKMHEIDDVATNKFSEIFTFYNFMPKYCMGLLGQVCITLDITLWLVKDHECKLC